MSFPPTNFLPLSSLCGHLSQKVNNQKLTKTITQASSPVWVGNMSEFYLFSSSNFFRDENRLLSIFRKEILELGPCIPLWFSQTMSPKLKRKPSSSSATSDLDLIWWPSCLLCIILVSYRRWSILPKSQYLKQVYQGYLWDEQGKHLNVLKCH